MLNHVNSSYVKPVRPTLSEYENQAAKRSIQEHIGQAIQGKMQKKIDEYGKQYQKKQV
jgi:hypothetical protein